MTKPGNTGETGEPSETPTQDPIPQERASPESPLILMGYIAIRPAEINVRILGQPELRPTALNIGEIKFLGPDVDLEPLFKYLTVELRAIKEDIAEIRRSSNPEKLSRFLGNELVGESFLRWDSRVHYYPTIIFIFLEPEEDYTQRNEGSPLKTIQRKVQLKARLTELDSESLSKVDLDSFIQNYREKALALKGFSFLSGGLRCHYVNPGTCRWKTTIFSDKEEVAHLVLSKICQYISQKYYPENLSVIKGKRSELYETPCLVTLFKIGIQLNKAEKQFSIYP